MDYRAFSEFAGTWGLVFLVAMFAVALIYALWPGNRDKFSRAAQTPLDDDDNHYREQSQNNDAYDGGREAGSGR